MENSCTYIIYFKDRSKMELEWTSKLITPKELEDYLKVISEKYDILNFKRIN
jgi:hypothetical protein